MRQIMNSLLEYGLIYGILILTILWVRFFLSIFDMLMG